MLEDIVNEIVNYDVYDILARLSCLNLLPENQNKSILLDALIASIMSREDNIYKSEYKMSNSKFRKIVDRLNHMDLNNAIDPNENAFIENVMCNGNYFVFNGIDQTPAFNLQMMIYSLFVHKNSFNQKYKNRAAKIILFILQISNIAIEALGYKIETLSPNEVKDIFIPDSKKIDLLKDLVVFNAEVVKWVLDDEELYKDLFMDFKNRDKDYSLNIHNQLFYSRPFVIDPNTGMVIVLNISLLPTYAFYRVLKLAADYSLKEVVLDAYNNYVFNECRKSLSKLGHNKIREKSWNIDLKDENFYKEVLLNVYNNQIMIVAFLCDDGMNYEVNTLHDNYPLDIHMKTLEQRLYYLSEEIRKNKIYLEDIFCLFIISGFGRGISITINNPFVYHLVSFNPFELRCISINERKMKAFLPRYLRSKNKLQFSLSDLISELNTIDIYVNNNYSFYLSDDLNPSSVTMYIAPGDSIEYIIKALNKEKRKLVDSYAEGFFTEIILNDPYRNIYVEANNNIPKASLYIPFSNLFIWIFSPNMKKYDEINLYFSIVDAISYWLAECREIIECSEFHGERIDIQIVLNGDLKEYYIGAEVNTSFENELKIEKNKYKITITWTPDAFRLLNKRDNSNEKRLIQYFLALISESAGVQLNKLNVLEYIFKDPMKMKFFALDYEKQPYLQPVKDPTIRKVHAEDEDLLLDMIGKEILESGKWSYGVVNDCERTTIANYIVDYLYGLLQEEIEVLSPLYFIEAIYNDLEIVMYNLMLSQRRYAYDIACYKEKEEILFNEYNELNRSSRTLKFLIEYIAACPPRGDKVLGEGKFEYLLAICSLIIDWAYKNDLFHYKIFNTPIEILPSDRIGMKQKEFNNMLNINIKYSEKQLNYNSSFEFREKYSSGKVFDYGDKLNEAFKDEYSYSFDSFCKIVFSLMTFGNEIDDDVKTADLSVLLSWLVTNNEEITLEIVEKVLYNISLRQRRDFLIPPDPYTKEDVYPWRMNREYSFTRRPLIIRNNQVIWGNRQLYHMLVFH